jgi:4-amino-4-deoxy-L-arabinose transferase-like glycosyltransferase
MLTRNLWLIAGAVGVVMFVGGVGFDLVLLKHQETPAAIVISNGLVALLAAMLVLTLLAYGRQQRRLIMERMEALNEVNHHIRNALQALAFTAGALQGTKEGVTVSESIQRIQWALLEVLPKVEPTYEPFQGSARQADAVRRDLG